MTLIPLLTFGGTRRGQPISIETTTGVAVTTLPPSKHMNDEITVYSPLEDAVINIKMRDYIIGAVSAEMPASYHIEALKAQAVACYTYAVKTIEFQSLHPSETLKGASLSADSNVHQAFINTEQMKAKWKDNYDANLEKIASAVDAVSDEMIVYNNEPIMAVFHAISAGKTETAENIWGGSYPYLNAVSSDGDTHSSQFSTTSVLSEKQFSEIAGKIDGVKLGKDPTKWLGKPEMSDSGTVLSMEIGGKKLSGTQIRSYFNLRSASFTLTYSTKNKNFTFTVHGFGHGVGMSQYGADYMARQGSTYIDILKHYYSEVEIIKQ